MLNICTGSSICRRRRNQTAGTDQAWKRTRIDSPKIGRGLSKSNFCQVWFKNDRGVAQIRIIRSKSTVYFPQKDKRQISCSKLRNKQNANRLKKPPGPCYHYGKWHWMKLCPVKKKTYCKNCNKNDLTQCWYANIMRKPKSKIRPAQSDEIVNRNLRKYATVDIFNNSIKFLLDSGSDISIINWRTWRKLNKPTLLKTDKTAKSVTGENINILGEVILTVTLNEVTKKLKAYVLKISDNLFGTDWMEKFNLWIAQWVHFVAK